MRLFAVFASMYNVLGINAIDPCVKQGDNGDLWMTFGSWFGGMWMFKLDHDVGSECF